MFRCIFVAATGQCNNIADALVGGTCKAHATNQACAFTGGGGVGGEGRCLKGQYIGGLCVRHAPMFRCSKAGCHRNGYSGMQGFCTVHFKLDHLTSLLADLQQKGVLKETLSKQVDATLDDGARKEAWGKIAEAKMQSK